MSTERKPLGIIRSAMLVGILSLFVSVFLHAYALRQDPEQQRQGFFNPYAGGTREYVAWPPLEQEKVLYREAGYDVDFMDGDTAHRLRKVLPFPAIFEVLALRLFGMCQLAPALLLVIAFGAIEGRMSNAEKTAQFHNVSSTRFRIAVLCCAGISALSFLFLCLPFGTDLPGIGTIPLTVQLGGGSQVWLTAPHMWATMLAPAFFMVPQQLMSNLARNI